LTEPRTADQTAPTKPKIKILSAKDVFDVAVDITTELVEIPEWGGAVYVRGLTALERDDLEQSCLEGKGRNQRVNMRNLRAKMAIMSTVDAEGTPLWDDGDVERLTRKSAKALDSIFKKAQLLSGMSDEDVDDLTKNSESQDQKGRFSSD
jgi:hypothetical protein